MRLRSWALVLAMVLLSGCSSADSPEQVADGAGDPLAGADLSDASAAQAAEISDREVTVDDYQAAFQRFRECLSAAGFEITDLEFRNHVYEFGVPNAAVEDGADADCYRAEFYYVDMLWQTSDIVQNASESTQLFRECLQERGIEPRDTAAEIDQQLREAGIEPPECLQ